MAKTVQLLGLAPNISDIPEVPGAERWAFNNPKVYALRFSPGTTTWTRWFNFHSHRHMLKTYPRGWQWYTQQDGSRPIYLQHAHPDVPGSVTFPRDEIQKFFASPSGEPETFFTCSLCWAIAFAIMEGFERIELWGFMLRRDSQYAYERPGAIYWIARARQAGIEVYIPEGVDLVTTPRIYGYETT